MSLAQQAELGGDPFRIDDAHALSELGLHVTDTAVGAWLSKRPKSSTMDRKRKDAFIFRHWKERGTRGEWVVGEGTSPLFMENHLELVRSRIRGSLNC